MLKASETVSLHNFAEKYPANEEIHIVRPIRKKSSKRSSSAHSENENGYNSTIKAPRDLTQS